MYPAKEVKVIMSQKHIALVPFFFEIIHLTPQYLSLLILVAVQPVGNVESGNLQKNCYLLFWLLLASFLFLLWAFVGRCNLEEHHFEYTLEDLPLLVMVLLLDPLNDCQEPAFVTSSSSSSVQPTSAKITGGASMTISASSFSKSSVLVGSLGIS